MTYIFFKLRTKPIRYYSKQIAERFTALVAAFEIIMGNIAIASAAVGTAAIRVNIFNSFVCSSCEKNCFSASLMA